MLTVSWNAVAPPAEVRRPRQTCQRLRMNRQHLRRALVRENQILIVAPTANLLGGPQSVGQRMFHLVEHRVAGPGAVRLAQLVRLIDGNPKHAKALAALLKVLEQRGEPVFKLRLIGLHLRAFAALAMRQRIQTLRGMKDNRQADAPAHLIAQHHAARNHRNLMAQLVLEANHGAVTRLRSFATLLICRLGAGQQQRLQRFGDGARQQVHRPHSR